MENEKFEASVGMSREWDAWEAGRDVAENTLKKLTNPPNFFLVFCTIDYDNNGGFQKFLEGIWDVLPKSTKLVGGTIAGFINNYGCYAFGASALAVSYKNLDVAVGCGYKTKRNPKRAGKKCSSMINRDLKKSPFEHRFLIEMISAPIIPNIPLMGDANNVRSKMLGDLIARFGMPLVHFFGSGIGKEQDVLELLAKELPDYYIIGGSSVDNGKMLSNYQFIDDKVLSNSVVALGGAIDIPIFYKMKNGVHKTEKTFNITKKMYHDYIIRKINNKSASSFFLKEILDIPSELFYDLGPFYYRTADYFPFTFEKNDERVIGIGSFLGNNILVSHKIPDKKAIMCSVTGDDIFNAIDYCIDDDLENFPFLFFSSSAIYSFILRNKTGMIKNILDKKIKDVPYLLIQPMIEHVYQPYGKPNVRAYSTNVLSFFKENVDCCK